MSIQGSVNQLFTIGGSFAGMYGLLHPEIAQRREVMKDIQASKDIVSKYEGKKDLSLGETDIIEKTVQRIEKNIEENPQLMKYPEIEKIYGKIKKSSSQRLQLQEEKRKLQAQTELQTEGMQKVNQRDAYAQRRKDKGDV